MLKNKGLFVILFSAFYIAFFQNAFGQEKKNNLLLPGSQAPTFTLPGADNNYVFLRDICGEKLRKPWKNKIKHVVVLSFFATWCVPCQKEIPRLMELQKRFSAENIKFFLIAVGEKKEKALSFARRKNYSLPLLFDQYQVVAKKYRVNSLPRLVIIDKNGIIRRYAIGFENRTNFETETATLLEKLLAE